MIRHYFKIAFRNLAKYKLQSIISITGLAVGIAFFILVSIGYATRLRMTTFIQLQIALSWSVIKQKHPMQYIFLPLYQHLSESIVQK